MMCALILTACISHVFFASGSQKNPHRGHSPEVLNSKLNITKSFACTVEARTRGSFMLRSI